MLINSGLSCDDCGSSDALAEYDNGFYCFSCSKWTRVKSDNVRFIKDHKKYAQKQQCTYPNNTIEIQSGGFADCFLRERHFTREQIFYYNIRQSVCGNYLILSETEGTLCKFVEIKKLRANIEGPKYISTDTKDSLYYGKAAIKTNAGSCIIVEDILSCMRVGWNYPCISLRGTKLTEKGLAVICNFKSPMHLYLWLDSDTPGQNATKKILQQLNWCGFSITTIKTEKDPKMYTDTEIKEILGDNHVF